MDKEVLIAWLAGMFEGEGCFVFTREKAKSLSITSTDKDVLLRIQEHFGGNINSATRKQNKPHWKDAWLWIAGGEKGVEICKLIYPYLLTRRKLRADEWLLSRHLMSERKEKNEDTQKNLEDKVLALRALGWTQQNIANEVGLERSSISKMIKRCLSLKRNKASTCDVEDGRSYLLKRPSI